MKNYTLESYVVEMQCAANFARLGEAEHRPQQVEGIKEMPLLSRSHRQNHLRHLSCLLCSVLYIRIQKKLFVLHVPCALSTKYACLVQCSRLSKTVTFEKNCFLAHSKEAIMEAQYQ